MRETTRNVMVGLFVLGSLSVLGVLMVMFGEMPFILGGQQWELRIVGVQEAEGIAEGTPVYMNGVEIGRVRRLEFKKPNRPGLGVDVVADIRDQFSIPRGSLAKLYAPSLGLGQGKVNIIVNTKDFTEQEPKDGTAAIRGFATSMFSELIPADFTDQLTRTVEHIGTLAAKTTPLIEKLGLLVEPRSIDDLNQPTAQEQGLTANMATVVERVDHLVANVNKVLGDQNVQGDVRDAVSDLRQSSTALRDAAELLRDRGDSITGKIDVGVDETRENLDQTFHRLIAVLDNLDATTKELAHLVNHVTDGKGTAGLLVNDDRLYEEGVLALKRLDEVLASIGRITGKIERDGYITVGQTTPVGTLTRDFEVGPEKK